MEKEITFKDISLFFSDPFDSKLDQSLDIILRVLNDFLSNQFSNKGLKYSLNINLVNDEEMKEVNAAHRGKDKTTDVLSFPMQESFRDELYDNFSKDICFGDILISKDVCLKQASEFNISFEDEFIHLCFHGFLHLLGYDHELNEDEEKLMGQFEKQLVDRASTIKKGDH